MVNAKRITPCQIAVMTALHKSAKDTDYISIETGVSIRSVRRWIKRFKDSPTGDVELQQKPKGRRKITGPRALRIIKRQVDANLSITSQELKEKNPGILGMVSC